MTDTNNTRKYGISADLSDALNKLNTLIELDQVLVIDQDYDDLERILMMKNLYAPIITKELWDIYHRIKEFELTGNRIN